MILDLHVEFGAADAGDFEKHHNVIALAEYVEWRERTSTARARFQPFAIAEGVERALQVEKSLERVGKQYHVCFSAIDRVRGLGIHAARPERPPGRERRGWPAAGPFWRYRVSAPSIEAWAGSERSRPAR